MCSALTCDRTFYAMWKERERATERWNWCRIFLIVHTRVLSLMVFVVLQHSSLSLLFSLSSHQTEMRLTECEQQTLIIIAWSHSWNMVHETCSFQTFHKFNGTIKKRASVPNIRGRAFEFDSFLDISTACQVLNCSNLRKSPKIVMQ